MKKLVKALRPFRGKLMLEAVAHAAAHGIAIGMAAVLALSLASRLIPREARFAQYLRLFTMVSAVAGCARYAFFLHPTMKRAAARVDRVGLEERISTMVAFCGDPSFICEAQRKDALEKLSRVRPKQLALSFPKRACFLCLVMAALVFGVSFVPHDILGAAPEQAETEAVESEEARLIRDMIADLREKIESADISETEKDLLLAQLQALEAGVTSGRVTLSDLAEISEATDKIADSFESSKLFQSWAAELTKYECLRALGIAILERNPDKVHLAFSDMEQGLLSATLTARADALSEMTRAIDATLTVEASRESEAELVSVFSSLSADLKSAAGDGDEQNVADGVQSAMHTAEERVLAYLSDEHANEPSEANLEKADHEDEDTGDDVIPPDAGGESARGQPAVNSETGAKMEEGANHRLMYGAEAKGGFDTGSGTMDRQYHAVTEVVYEPSLDPAGQRADYVPGARSDDGAVQRERAATSGNEGTVPYGQVYGVYLAKLLEQISGEEIPDSLIHVVEEYFYGL